MGWSCLVVALKQGVLSGFGWACTPLVAGESAHTPAHSHTYTTPHCATLPQPLGGPSCSRHIAHPHQPTHDNTLKSAAALTCVAVLNASHLQHLLGCAGSNNTSTTGSGDQANGHTAALASDLCGHSVHLCKQTNRQTDKDVEKRGDGQTSRQQVRTGQRERVALAADHLSNGSRGCT